MWRVTAFAAACFLVAGCASGQLNYNTLDLASTTNYLLTAQIIENLARFIDSDTAVPAQVLMNGGTATTANTISPQFTDPLSKAVTVGTTVATAAATATTNSISAVTAAKSLTLSASNVSTQNWAFEPIVDQDQLRRLYDLYRFAVIGNGTLKAQAFLLSDYPLPFRPGSPTSSALVVDTVALSGPNCVLCSADASHGGCTPRPEGVCVALNPRLLPTGTGNSSWLRWTNVAGARLRDEGRAPRSDDLYIGQRGNYMLYVDSDQAERYAEFGLLVAAAANSAPNPSSASSSAGGTPRPKGAIATPNGFLLSN